MSQVFAILLIFSRHAAARMRRFFPAGAASAALALAACNAGGAPAGNASRAQDSSAAAMQARLETLSEAQRNAVFMRAVRDADQDCQQVERSERAGEHQGLPVWRAYCRSGVSFTIVIARGGSAQVLNDSEFRLSHEAPPSQGGRGQ